MAEDEVESISESRIEYKSVKDLASSIDRCEGHFSFLIGAGTSKNGGIPTANELVAKWRKKQFEIEHSNDEASDFSDSEIHEWAQSIEAEEMGEAEHPYGFWFEKEYTTRGERRQAVREMVKDAEPTFGHIVLASLMKDGFVPLALTPNFDDLLYDSFYLFLEEKPMMIDHHAIASQFQLTQERPTIIKLHGDYLYDNLKNTNSETKELELDMEKAVSRSLDEYGMVVVGYGGNDRSIMEIMNSDNIDIPDYGLFWCKLKDSELSSEVKELLQKPNTFLVEIDGFGELLSGLYSEIDGLTVPMPNEIISRAKNREQMLMKKVSETEGTGTLQLKMSADEYVNNGNYDTAIELFSQIINNNGSKEADHNVYTGRARAYFRNGEMENGIEDYKKAVDAIERPGQYLNLAEGQIMNNEPDDAIKSIKKAKEMDGNSDEGIMTFLEILSKILLDKDYSDDVEKLEQLEMDDFGFAWEFETLRIAVKQMEIDEEKREKISDVIDAVAHNKVEIL